MNPVQLKRIERFSKLVPQIKNPPKFLIKFLSSIIPDYCPFERTFIYKGRLLLYIPKLCYLNPLYEAICDYRLSTYFLED